MKHKESNFFWTSYTDLMTSLFFVMLALYILTVAVLRYQQKATEEQLKKIKEIQNATKALDTTYFEYQPKYKRFTLKTQINFPPKSFEIPSNNNDYLIQVGKSIQKLVDTLKVKYKDSNIKYLIVIEGMASKDNYAYNYQLSYERALSLYNFWQNKNIVLDPSICEVIISGSGIGGVGRFERGNEEYKNQRFLIQIIPKIGTIEELVKPIIK
jgi:outer membrane protein OmpA-like peptidoglycan-associated protein